MVIQQAAASSRCSLSLDRVYEWFSFSNEYFSLPRSVCQVVAHVLGESILPEGSFFGIRPWVR